jgi:hypothetical protein
VDGESNLAVLNVSAPRPPGPHLAGLLFGTLSLGPARKGRTATVAFKRACHIESVRGGAIEGKRIGRLPTVVANVAAVANVSR